MAVGPSLETASGRGRMSVAITASVPYRSRREVTSSDPICPPAPVMTILFKLRCLRVFVFSVECRWNIGQSLISVDHCDALRWQPISYDQESSLDTLERCRVLQAELKQYVRRYLKPFL